MCLPEIEHVASRYLMYAQNHDGLGASWILVGTTPRGNMIDKLRPYIKNDQLWMYPTTKLTPNSSVST